MIMIIDYGGKYKREFIVKHLLLTQSFFKRKKRLS